MKKLIFDPLEEYRDNFKHTHDENVNKFFDDLVKQSGVNLGENDLTVKEIKTLEERIKNEDKLLAKAKNWRGFLLILTIVAFIVAFILIFMGATNSEGDGAISLPLGITLGVVCIVVAVIFILIMVKVLRPRIKGGESRLSELHAKLEQQLNIAWGQMSALNNLFDATMTPMLVEKTIPLLNMDPLFDSRRFDYLNRKYNLSEQTDVNQSTLFVQSGQIQGNPFLLTRSLYMDMGTKTYTGTLVVTYTVTVYVNNKPQRQTKTQTLTASVEKPCPYYSNDTIIVYGNEAAPNLSFNRYPQLDINWTKKSLDAFVKKEEKEMQRIADKSLKKGLNFQPLGNTEFEALFNAYNRDHELEYRLLFTALGQSEISDLIKDKTVGFGDDFEFHKVKNINIVRSRHSQQFDYSANPRNYVHYDNKEIRRLFVTYNNDYLRYFYFNIAPVLAIPLYQQHKPQEFIYNTEYKSHLSFYEHEAIVNEFPASYLAHPQSETKNILKTRLIAKGVDYDSVEITSHGFRTVNRTDYVARTAGNGTVHQVPVHWVEYIPVEQTNTASIKVLNQDNRDKVQDDNFFGKIGKYLSRYTDEKTPVSGRHVMAFILASNFTNKDNDALNKFISETNE